MAATPSDTDQPSHNPRESTGVAAEVTRAEMLASLRDDISEIIRGEIKKALTEDFNALKSEIQGLRAEIANNTKVVREEIEHVKAEVQDMKGGLSTWSDEVTTLQETVSSLQDQMSTLKDKCEDMEGRMRRSNIRIAGIAEQPNSSTPKAVASALKELLQLDREVKIDRSHRTLAYGNARDRDKPRVIIAKLHNDYDAVEILRKAREKAPLTFNGQRIAIFPDYTASVAKARAMFTDVRKALRGRRDIRYGLLYPARLRITFKDVSKEFVDHHEAMNYVKTIPPEAEG